jgi:hypothetical protein
LNRSFNYNKIKIDRFLSFKNETLYKDIIKNETLLPLPQNIPMLEEFKEKTTPLSELENTSFVKKELNICNHIFNSIMIKQNKKFTSF